MADIKNMPRAIHSALRENGVTAELNIHMDGNQAIATIGQSGGDDLEVSVEIHDLHHDKAGLLGIPTSRAASSSACAPERLVPLRRV